MGLDGGTIPTRTDILRGASWNISNTLSSNRSTRGGNFTGNSTGRNGLDTTAQIASDTGLRSRWESCALSGVVFEDDAQLKQVMMCQLGFLYLKEPLLEYMLGQGAFERRRKRFAHVFGHLRSLKDVFSVHLHKNPEKQQPEGEPPARFACPITGLPCNGKYRFVALSSCGHCFAEKTPVSYTHLTLPTIYSV
eukprot:TRINITY_DN26425_c0_g1_i1.p1 TRINITY_DN26425_c0_g1~~TRINITY_DN26425_c0_g1_i1.p1  ORF type:complete len:193 (-),score=29.13 TRINITY_DN26425_c0_g1_i1:138-716(-)